jgi:hypothetical protein
VDVFFSTGNFYFFLNLEKNAINIPSIPVNVFYRYVEKGYVEKVFFSIILLPYRDDIKDKINDCKKELNKVLPLYEKNINDEELVMKVVM